VQKTLVFADENVAFKLSMPEHLSVASLRQPDIEYVFAWQPRDSMKRASAAGS
jgi:hypothetical protein